MGSRSHFVSIGQEEEEDVREFGVYTKDHKAMIGWLKENNIATIAMESTGSYRRATSWQTLFSALQSAGFEVLLVNGRDIKNVKGKKTDVMDCMRQPRCGYSNYTVLDFSEEVFYQMSILANYRHITITDNF